MAMQISHGIITEKIRPVLREVYSFIINQDLRLIGKHRRLVMCSALTLFNDTDKRIFAERRLGPLRLAKPEHHVTRID